TAISRKRIKSLLSTETPCDTDQTSISLIVVQHARQEASTRGASVQRDRASPTLQGVR
ncbi:hypothetical protein RRG08_001189, partial [Elysia crispata]